MTEELNLKELFSKFVKFFIRNKRVLLSFVIFGVLAVVLYQSFKTPYYETKAICMSGISDYERQDQIEGLSQRTAIDLINHLQINIENEDISQIAKTLGIEENVASTIKKIEAEQLYQQDMDEKFYALNKFEVLLVVYDNLMINQIQRGLTYYFESNKFVKSHYEKYLESNLSILNNIEEEMSLLSSTRVEGAKNNLDISSVSVISGDEGNKITNQIISLSLLREEIKVKYELLTPLVYVQQFANVHKKEDDILLWSFLVGIISLFIGMLYSLIKEVR